MDELESAVPTISLRDVLAVLFRHKLSMAVVYASVVLVSAAYCFFWPPTYEAGVRFLVKHDREEPVLSADPASVRMLSKQIVSEDDLNSEAAIMQSPVVLEQTVRETGMMDIPDHWLIRLINRPIGFAADVYNQYHGQKGAEPLAQAADRLGRRLTVEPEKKSAILDVRVRWGSPEYARLVLEKLSASYLRHHTEVHHIADSQSFFLGQVNAKKAELATLEGQIEALRPGATLGNLTLDRDLLTRQANDFESEWRRARALKAQSEARVEGTGSELAGMPERIVTEEKPVVNQLAIGTLKGRVLELQLKVTELERKYQPGNTLVIQAREELTRAEAMLAAETGETFTQKTMDANRVSQALRQDLAQNRAGLKAAAALENAMRAEYEEYRKRLDLYNEQSRKLENLDRERRTVEATLVQYQRQYEAARASDGMNRTRILNVTPLEPVWVDPVPVKPNSMVILKLALGAGLLFALGWAFLLELLDPRVRVARDIETHLRTPVLATFDLYTGKDLKAPGPA